MTTSIVWLRRDLRLEDNPALTAAAQADETVPVFIFDDALLHGRHASGPRVSFLLECLSDLKQRLQAIGSDLVVRHGKPEVVLPELARETGATSLLFAADATAYARKRDHRVADALQSAGVAVHAHPGLTVATNLESIKSPSSGKPYSVFTPFFNTWQTLERRPLLSAPTSLKLPKSLSAGELPTLSQLELDHHGVTPTIQGGETNAHRILSAFLENGVQDYTSNHNAVGADKTSHLSAYLHFGCLSPRQVEEAAPGGEAGDNFVRQIAWRDFYHYVLWHNPANTTLEFQERYRGLAWNSNADWLKAWQTGTTGYPLVDAGMRQLLAEGWMHNRARLVVGSFLTKDLGLDWREGERWFMKLLIDGDQANNNGNWQWIASVGTDPAPLFRRLYNPILHQERYDPDGVYVRKYLPELANVPLKYLSQPWTMPADVQEQVGCKIGKDYPEPIVDHKVARAEAIERYQG